MSTLIATLPPPRFPFYMPEVKTESKYSQWLRSALRRRDMDLADLGRRVNSDYNYMWRLSSGVRKRPGYELAVAIGNELGDTEGSLVAAEYSLLTQSARIDPLLAYGDEVDARPYMYALSSVQNASGGLGIERIIEGDTPGEDYRRNGWRVRAIRIRGDSMEPVLHDGEVALVLPAEAVYDGCFVTATVDFTNAVCKRVHISVDGSSYLEGMNGDGVIPEDRFTITGVVADKVSPLLPPKNVRTTV